MHTKELRLHHPQTFELLFQCELYYNFGDDGFYTIKKENDSCFHYFRAPGGLIGLSFADKDEAGDFYKKVKKWR